MIRIIFIFRLSVVDVERNSRARASLSIHFDHKYVNSFIPLHLIFLFSKQYESTEYKNPKSSLSYQKINVRMEFLMSFGQLQRELNPSISLVSMFFSFLLKLQKSHHTDGWLTVVDYGYSWLLIHQKMLA